MLVWIGALVGNDVCDSGLAGREEDGQRGNRCRQWRRRVINERVQAGGLRRGGGG